MKWFIAFLLFLFCGGCGNSPLGLVFGVDVVQEINHQAQIADLQEQIDELQTMLDGVDGADGSDGIDGLDGKDGADGKDGIDGRNDVDGCNKVTMCQKGVTIKPCENAKQAHLDHGDTEGACP